MNKTGKKPTNTWVSLCSVTKRLAEWGELLSPGSHVRVVSGTPKAPLQAVFRRFAAFFILLLPAHRSFETGRILTLDRVFQEEPNGFHGSAKKNRSRANWIFRTHLPPGAAESSAARVFASSGDCRSCSTRASRSNVAGACSLGSSGGWTSRRLGLA